MPNIFRLTTKEEFLNPIMGQVIPLIAFVEKRGLVAGTCVLVAPYLALTAKHVLEEIYTFFGFKTSDKHINLDIYLPQFTTGSVWYVSQSFAWIGTDIAFLRLHPHPRVEQSKTPNATLKMTVDPPAVGSEIVALGYPKTEISMERNDNEVTAIKLNIRPTVSSGVVTEIHRSVRDSSMVNFPSFSVNARFPAGMSGGAVFNEKKELCGLVCTGENDGKESAISYSTAVSIWPSMLITTTFNSDDYLPSADLKANHPYSALELARRGILNVVGHERIEFFKHENGSDGVRRKHY